MANLFIQRLQYTKKTTFKVSRHCQSIEVVVEIENLTMPLRTPNRHSLLDINWKYNKLFFVVSGGLLL